MGARIEDSPGGRLLVSAVNGLIGDRLAEQQHELAITMAVRRHGRDVPLTPEALAEAFPAATSDLVIFLHGLGEADEAWQRGARESGGSYGKRLAADTSWSPVYLRANSGLPIAENGVALASLIDDLVAAWPIRRTPDRAGRALDGRAGHAGRLRRGHRRRPAVEPARHRRRHARHARTSERRWSAGVALGARALGRLPESAPFGRILEYRSVGILDLRGGLAPDLQNLPHARYHLVAATLATSRGTR